MAMGGDLVAGRGQGNYPSAASNHNNINNNILSFGLASNDKDDSNIIVRTSSSIPYRPVKIAVAANDDETRKPATPKKQFVVPKEDDKDMEEQASCCHNRCKAASSHMRGGTTCWRVDTNIRRPVIVHHPTNSAESIRYRFLNRLGFPPKKAYPHQLYCKHHMQGMRRTEPMVVGPRASSAATTVASSYGGGRRGGGGGRPVWKSFEETLKGDHGLIVPEEQPHEQDQEGKDSTGDHGQSPAFLDAPSSPKSVLTPQAIISPRPSTRRRSRRHVSSTLTRPYSMTRVPLLPKLEEEEETEHQYPEEEEQKEEKYVRIVKGVKFKSRVLVHPIPSCTPYSDRIRQALWISAVEMEVNAARNSIEFEAESWDWRKAANDEDMIRYQGQWVHPVHLVDHHCHPDQYDDYNI